MPAGSRGKSMQDGNRGEARRVNNRNQVRNEVLYQQRSPFRPTPPSAPMVKPESDEQNATEHHIRLTNLPPETTTLMVFNKYKIWGNIILIELYEDRNGRREGSGKVIFSPPPKEPFGLYSSKVKADNRRRTNSWQVQSPVRGDIYYEPVMKLKPTAMHFGLMIDPESMMHLETVRSNSISNQELDFVVDLKRRQISAAFWIQFVDPRSKGATDFVSDSTVGQYDRANKFMFQVSFNELKTIRRLEMPDDSFALAMTLDSPPAYYRKREDETTGHSDEGLKWNEFLTWFRQTDIVFDPYLLGTAKIALNKERPVIDIGRWTTYLFQFKTSDNAIYDKMKQALQDFNIDIVSIDQLNKIPAHHPPKLWSLINTPKSPQTSTSLHFLQDSQDTFHLPFEVRYQLEVCISHGIINEYNITRPFVERLAAIAAVDVVKARNILEYVAGEDKRVYNPMTILDDPAALSFTAKTEIPYYCAYSRKATITPSMVYFSSPTVETTNRVLRHYKRENDEGRFLRVQFTDEIGEGQINSRADSEQNDEIFTRVYRTIYNGIQIGERHYEFLAFGNSQFRENGAYFFCPTDHLSCDDIRRWMGDFSNIRVVAKYAARLGQCFSTTRAINGLSSPMVVKIDDIESGGHCFTDGVGKISPFLAQMIANELGIRSNAPPSAFQIRLGGCKGILVVWPEVGDRQVHIRPSQQKFKAIYNGLEVIKCSRFSCAALNRQTITILSSLGVPDEVFLRMLLEQLASYQSAMDNDEVAKSLLLKYIDDNQMTINIATMIRNGFMAEKDPFVMSVLHLWRAWSIKLLKDKAKIIVENGAFVLGCADETGTLRGYTKSTVHRGKLCPTEELPQIFLQIPNKDDPKRYNVVEGICLVGRNPSLHPGDMRVVMAVDVPKLHHIRDVVVFPTKGDQDVPSMCSGGDLDGDDFFVIWDEALIPREWNVGPMNYSAPVPKALNRPVQVTDLLKFFVRYMKNDSLPTIALAHLAQSDFLGASVKDPKCLELAALHSKAVDYVKTGEPAQMPKRLVPQKWPHFMEKRYKPKKAQYISKKILGQLYDRVEKVNFVPLYNLPFDKRILQAYTLDDGLLRSIRQIKSKYDIAMRRLLAQHDIKTEFEIWTTFVLSRPRVGSDYKVQEEIGHLSDALKDQFRAICIDKAGGKAFSLMGPFVAGMYKVTKEELDIALAECHTVVIRGGREHPKRTMEPKSMPLISFPWLFEKELGRIATGVDVSDEVANLGLATLPSDQVLRSRQRGRGADVDDYIQQEDGVIIHRGEALDLFHQDVESDFADSDFENARSDTHGSVGGHTDETVLATKRDVSQSNARGHLLSGTGVEEVVPHVPMDGFVHPQGTIGASSTDTLRAETWQEIARPYTSGNTTSPSIQSVNSSPADALVVVDDDLRHIDLRDGSGENNYAIVDQEEVVTIQLRESVPDMVDRVLGKAEKSDERREDQETEEEVVTLEIRESPFERAARLMGS